MQTTEMQEGCSQAFKDVFTERQRQLDKLGWNEEHDDKYNDGALAGAAINYASPESISPEHQSTPPFYLHWPWPLEWWKPSNYRRNLVKAAALIVAEIERLDRKGSEKQ